MWLNASIQACVVFLQCLWERVSFCSCKWKGDRKTSQKPALPTQNTQTRHSQAFRLSCSLYVFHTVSLSQAVSLSLFFSLSLWGVITVVGSSRVGKRFSFPLWLPPSKLCTGYYRDLFTKCSFCLFLSSPLCSQSLHFPFKFLPLPLSCLKLSVSPNVLTDAFIRLSSYFFLSLLPAVSIPDYTHNTHLHTIMSIIWKYDCEWYWTAVCVWQMMNVEGEINGKKQTYFCSHGILILCNFRIVTD